VPILIIFVNLIRSAQRILKIFSSGKWNDKIGNWCEDIADTTHNHICHFGTGEQRNRTRLCNRNSLRQSALLHEYRLMCPVSHRNNHRSNHCIYNCRQWRNSTFGVICIQNDFLLAEFVKNQRIWQKSICFLSKRSYNNNSHIQIKVLILCFHGFYDFGIRFNRIHWKRMVMIWTKKWFPIY
jgi:hypothetical protein